MFHPVLPPDPLPIVEPSKPSNELSVALAGSSESPKILLSKKLGNFPGLSNVIKANRADSVVYQNLSPSPVPEVLPSEFSPLRASIKVRLLKKPKSQILTKKAASPVEAAVSVQQLDGKINISVSTGKIAQDSPPQDIQNIIEFKPRRQNNQPLNPSDSELSPPPVQEIPPQIQPPTESPSGRQRIVEVIADRQEYDEQRRVVIAVGNVVVRFDGGVVDADRLQVNLDNLIAVGEGNVALTRGNQVLRGERFTYNFVQDNGDLENGKGEIYVPTTGIDFAGSPILPTDITSGGVPNRPPSDRIRANQPISGVTTSGGIDLTIGGQADARNIPPPKSGGIIKRLRFEAQRIDFYPLGWQAKDVRITNDPFSPPELELRASDVTVTREAPLIDRIRTQHQRLVFDQKVSLPIPVDNQKIDRREKKVPPIISVGFDNGKRGGLYVERGFQPINTDQARLTVTPQFFVQKTLENSGNVADLFGIKSKLNATLTPKTQLEGTGELTSFDLNKVEDSLRASLRLRQTLGEVNPYTLNVEYSYRDRLYNGTLGYQTVQSSLGGVITSPIIPLGKSGINLSYQGGVQYIDANTDRQDLLKTQRENDRISLGRFQIEEPKSFNLFVA